MHKITDIKALEILDSRGNPTVEVHMNTVNYSAFASVPSGASTGKHEAHELRDLGKRYSGLGVKKSVFHINNEIRKKLIDKDLGNQNFIDNSMIRLDGTYNKTKLGANSTLAVSLAYARLSAISKGIPLYRYIAEISGNDNILLPIPFMNVINGGMHAGNGLAFQEYMIVPSANNFSESLRIGTETYHELKKIIIKKYGKQYSNVGDEGGFAPNLKYVKEPLDLITKAIENLGYGKNIKIALDVASSSFYNPKNNSYRVDNKNLNTEMLIKLYESLISTYDIISIEDSFEQSKFHDFRKFAYRNKDFNVVGDDLTVTNIERIKKAILLKSCNVLLLKPNQIGTLTESINAAKLAKSHNWNVIVSHRSGETEDSFIADLSVGLGTGHIKSGAPCRSERLSKYNQLLRIEYELGNRAKFPKRPFSKNSSKNFIEKFLYKT